MITIIVEKDYNQTPQIISILKISARRNIPFIEYYRIDYDRNEQLDNLFYISISHFYKFFEFISKEQNMNTLICCGFGSKERRS
jgi:hypothetical protein